MKKCIAVLFALFLAITFISVFAEEATDTSENSESLFEQALLKKGTLVVKNFITRSTINTEFRTITLQTATITDVETGIKYYALRMEHPYYNSQYDSGTSIGVLDMDEIDGAITTLEYISDHISEMTDYTEITYKATSGLEIGAYKNSSEEYLYIKFSSRDTEFIKVSDISSVISALRSAKIMLRVQ